MRVNASPTWPDSLRARALATGYSGQVEEGNRWAEGQRLDPGAKVPLAVPKKYNGSHASLTAMDCDGKIVMRVNNWTDLHVQDGKTWRIKKIDLGSKGDQKAKSDTAVFAPKRKNSGILIGVGWLAGGKQADLLTLAKVGAGKASCADVTNADLRAFCQRIIDQTGKCDTIGDPTMKGFCKGAFVERQGCSQFADDLKWLCDMTNYQKDADVFCAFFKNDDLHRLCRVSYMESARGDCDGMKDAGLKASCKAL